MESFENPKRRPSPATILQIIALFAAAPLAYWVATIA